MNSKRFYSKFQFEQNHGENLLKPSLMSLNNDVNSMKFDLMIISMNDVNR